MRRRDVLASGLAAAATLVAAPRAFGAQHCLERDLCEVGVPAPAVRMPLQLCEEWCWAAAIQTVFLLHGHEVDQREIVERLYGRQVCAPASDRQILSVIEGHWIDGRGRAFRARADLLADSASDYERADFYMAMFGDLKRGWPLLVGALRHVTVITALGYRPEPFFPLYVTVRDPWPYGRNRRRLSPREMRAASFVTRVLVEG